MTEQLENNVQFARFAVNEAPYCVWEWDLHERNLEFIESLNPEYFEYIAKSQAEGLETEHDRLAAVALRIAYGQGLETLFSIICAALQAPDCVAGWLAKYRVSELHSLVGKISRGQDILTKITLVKSSWQGVSHAIHSFSMEDTDKEQRIKDGFGSLWARFARDFSDRLLSEEYNSIKHGLRVHAGGFGLSVGFEDIPGVPPPRERMRTIGASKFGCTFFSPEPVLDNRAFRIRRVSRNWVPVNLISGLLLISGSLRNVISFLRSANGVPAESVRYSWPSDLMAFRQPWAQSAGATSFNVDSVVSSEEVLPFTAEEILAVYRSEADSA